MMHWFRMPSPVGTLLLVGEDDALVEIGFESGKRPGRVPADGTENREPFEDAIRQLEEYFAGRRREFELNLAPRGTDFQRRVWNALLEIPYGETCTYSDIAKKLRNPNAVRAVGLANGRNPLPIVIPCHRVIGADGSLTGYGGGLAIKRQLLALEGQALLQKRM